MTPGDAPKPGPASATDDTQPRIKLAVHPTPLAHAERCVLFGRFSYTPDPQPDNPEHIAIAEPWERQNIVTVTIEPFGKRRTRVHKLIARQFLALWDAWQLAGLLPRVLTFDGAFAPRFKRGYRFGDANLSNHAWGSAFDINARWNPLGATPAAAGTKGSTRELVALANVHGFAWGGEFHTRPDGMHFEAYKVIP